MEEKKRLNAKEVAQLLGIPMVTVLRWAHQGKIPCKYKGDSYVFKKKEILDWAGSHNFMLVKKETATPTIPGKESINLKHAIEQGGFFYNLPGSDIYSVLKNALDVVRLPEGTDKEQVLNELLNREEIASTGIGKGIAIPHPRCAIDLGLAAPAIFVVFQEKPVDFNAVDGVGVFVLFLLFSPATDIHLKLLSRLSLCLRNEEFLTLLKRKAGKDELISKIEQIEKEIDASPDRSNRT
ncbi:MAG: PTS sugar transporter subunit IIA [Candidatus Aminicenantes bacterium]|nr:PTS sugar transporter subunit IIA [Candidatus Aminicenantes bacterium]